jgi:hypothetical protein
MIDTPSQTAPPVPANPPQDSVWDHPTAVASIAVASAAILAGLLYAAGFFSGDTGDEPPIRVKNGSVDFYLATSTQRWKPKNDKVFKITGGKRSKDGLDVTIAVNAGASCTSQAATGDQVTIDYVKADNVAVTLTIGTDPDRPHQRHSAVQSSEPLTFSSADARVLRYVSAGGYIRAILLDGNKMCTFTGPDQLANLVILDY